MKKRRNQSLTKLANAAFRQAAKKVIERAEATGTPVIVWENGSVTKLEPGKALKRKKRRSTSRSRTG